VPQVCKLYGWPFGPIPGQTVGILAASHGFDPNDIALYYQNLNKSLYAAGWYVQGAGSAWGGTAGQPPGGAVPGNLVPPTVVVALGTNSGSSDGELNMDISLSSSVAQGAEIAVYLFDDTVNGWITALGQAISPTQRPGQPPPPKPSVISSSYYFAGGDDATGLAEWGHSASDIASITSYFQDAQTMGVTVCIASGDNGTDSGEVGDGYAHVLYPASDPGVLTCGGTTIGNISGSNFSEYIWNDFWGASGGGVSAFFNSTNPNPAFRQPSFSYQAGTGVPVSLNDSSIGRGVPDVAANASPFSGYYIYTNGVVAIEGGTSASAPLIAGFIAQVNAKLGKNVGFLNPLLYAGYGSMCRKIVGGRPLDGIYQAQPCPADNACDGVTGYPGTQTGWDACTGWGVFDWNPLLIALGQPPPKGGKEKEKDEQKEAKDAIDGKSWKERSKEHYIDKIYPEGQPVPGVPSFSQLTQLAQSVDRLEQGLRELRAFIRPEERPAVGQQTLAESAKK
jgi:kumamolisin